MVFLVLALPKQPVAKAKRPGVSTSSGTADVFYIIVEVPTIKVLSR